MMNLKVFLLIGSVFCGLASAEAREKLKPSPREAELFRKAEKDLADGFREFKDDRDMHPIHAKSGLFLAEIDTVIQMDCTEKFYSTNIGEIITTYRADVYYGGKNKQGIVKLVSRRPSLPEEDRTEWKQETETEYKRTKLTDLFTEGEMLVSEVDAFDSEGRPSSRRVISSTTLVWKTVPVKRAGTLEYMLVLEKKRTLHDGGMQVDKIICQ